MGLPRLQTCCFVLDLKTGNIVLGSINAFFSFIMFVWMAVVASMIGQKEYEVIEDDDNNNMESIEAQAELTGFYAMSVILVFMFLAKFLFDMLFVYGVIAERATIIKVYFVTWIVFFLLSMFTFFINVTSYGGSTVVVELFYIGLNVYAILLNYSFYKQLNEREEV